KMTGTSFELRERYLPHRPTPTLAVTGACNAGKSTLVNALLEEEISPVDVLPATTCPLIFHYGETVSVSMNGKFLKKVQSGRELAFLLRQKNIPSNLIEITMPNPQLKKYTLIDTPGLDAANQNQLLQEIIPRVDILLYLFHQRGLDDRDRYFLHRLKGSSFLHNLPGRISFWINSNCGHPDGSALASTRAALSEIFGSEVPVNYVDTRNRESVENLRQFIEVELALLILKEIEKQLKEEDRYIPRRLAGTLSIKDDGHFLCAFWDIYERARAALETGRQFVTLQEMRSGIRARLDEFNRKIPLTHACPQAAGESWQTVNFSLIKERLQNLLQRLLKEPALKATSIRNRLKELAGSIANDRFFIPLWGPFSSGKSSFLNALMQEALLPAQDKPTTSSVIRLHYGTEKLAVAHYPLQVTIPLLDEREGEVFLCRDELAVLNDWLQKPYFLNTLRGIEARTGGEFSQVDTAQLHTLLTRTQNLFRPPAFPVKFSHHVPTITRPIPAKRAAQAVKAVRISFHNAREKTYHLADPGELMEFKNLITAPEEAILVDGIDIYHPAEIFQLATFVDTPGIDSVHTRYAETVTSWLSRSDVHLVFFNGRHMLSSTHREILRNMVFPDKWRENCFCVVNFADTLNRSEKERVAAFLRRELASPAPPEIYFISALEALKDKNNPAFNQFLRRLERFILARRGEKVLMQRIEQIKELLTAMQALEKYRRELEEIRLLLKQ
ncbi:MAG: dynamin family protein, partial [Desulfofundulus sp.]